MARPNGVVIVSEHFWAFSTNAGELHEGEMPSRRPAAARIPLLRGLMQLAASMAPLARGRGVARPRERLFLLCALLAPLCFVMLPSRLELPAGLLTTALIILWLFRGRTLRLHGAEHRAIAALEERRLRETWHGTARPSRFSLRCGTNFAALLMPIAVFGGHYWPLPATALSPLVISVLALGVTMELWLLVQGSRRLARVVLLPGLGLQRLTTREPRLDETRVALTALAAVLRRELAHG
jgi:uncharacterized protein YqhQ